MLCVPTHLLFYYFLLSVRSFRHEMMLPDDMIPDVWKNIDHNSNQNEKNSPTVLNSTGYNLNHGHPEYDSKAPPYIDA